MKIEAGSGALGKAEMYCKNKRFGDLRRKHADRKRDISSGDTTHK